MIFAVTICLIFMGTFIETSYLPSVVPMSPYYDATPNRPSEGSEDIGKPKTTKDLLQGFGDTKRQIIEESIYNETKCMKICWKNILYVNESHGVVTPWHEYQVIFNTPAEDNQTSNEPAKEYKKYGIQMEDNQIVSRDFEVVEKHPTYTVSKHENVTCGKGKFLAKAYYEWPKADKKKIVLRLTNEYAGLRYDRHDFVDAKVESNDDIVGSGSPQVSSFKSLNGDSINANGSKTRETSISKPPKGETGSENSEEDTEASSEIINSSGTDKRDSQEDNDSQSSLPDGLANPTSTMDPCSPFLTQLLSGNGLLSGLCKLKKNDTVLLQGDIIVSRKYFNEKNKTDVIKPMFVIHENTEIGASMDKVEENVI